MSDSVKQLLEGLESLLPTTQTYALHEPLFGEEEQALVADCISSGWVSSVGAYVDQFEQDLADYTGAKHAVVTMNGTAALHLATELAGVKQGDEVLCPALTFVATANAIHYAGAVPHFVEVDETRLTVCPTKLRSYLEQATIRQGNLLINKETSRPIRALMVMHAFGHPADLDLLKSLCEEFGLALIEDAAESLGSFYGGVHTGNHGVTSALSFNGNKILTTGGGGALLTNDSELAAHAKHISTTAKQPHTYEYVHDAIGYNYRMPNLNAALGVAQLKKLPDYLVAKRRLAGRYASICAEIEGIEFMAEPEGCASNYWLNVVKVKDAETKTELLGALHDREILARPIWRPMHLLAPYAECSRADLSVTERLYDQVINLPSSVSIAP